MAALPIVLLVMGKYVWQAKSTLFAKMTRLFANLSPIPGGMSTALLGVLFKHGAVTESTVLFFVLGYKQPGACRKEQSQAVFSEFT
jgi:hypothetical protein